ncbi:transcription factor 25 [Labeo rohita]|uniref:Transcription factor 25 n=1 Tax=Labeo rohita TaxID=84645 RepID=A0A498MFB7_LABRO|nr:transcription factor 25 [Labeo rohita]
MKGEQRAQAALNALKLTDEDDRDEKEHMKSDKTGHKQKNISNIFELIGEAGVDVCASDEETAERIGDGQQGGASLEKDAVKDNLSVGDDIDAFLETLDKKKGLSYQSAENSTSEHRPVLYVEHRSKQRQRQFHRCTWMTVFKDTWPRFSRPGISMALVESKDGIQHFTFEHNRDYQQVQFKFFEAVESMDPNNFVVLLQLNPYHIDSLLQLSDVCRMQEDQETARDLIERALYSFECAFHPVFSLTSGTCRLDYRRPENRAFYLVLFKHMIFLEKRGCPRTALEYCKLILSLDPDDDPLCMLLIFDFLCLRCREYTTLIRLYEEWEVIDEKVNTVLVAINDQTVQFKALVERVGQAEERIAGVENSTESLQATVADLQKKVSEMSAHIDDLENRGRGCNLRLVGLPEGTEGSDPVHFFEKWLPDYLKIATKAGRIKLDRAHRSLAPLPGPAQRPSPVIIKFHNFTDKQRVLNAARQGGTDPEGSAKAGPRISFFSDYSVMVIKKRKAFDDVKKRLQKMKIEYALLYPATRFTINGTLKRFASPDDVTAFIDSLG